MTSTYSYDALGRPVAIAHDGGDSISYAYDDAGNRTRMTTPAGDYLYSYDARNQISSVIDPNNQQTSFAYNAVGLLNAIQRPNGVTTSYSYDARHFLTQINHVQGTSTLASYSYTYDPAGNRTSETDLAGRVTTWQYDPAERLIRETDSLNGVAFSTNYAYDPAGNRIRETRPNGDILRYTYNANDQLTRLDLPNYQSETYLYDGRGNLVQTQMKQGLVTVATENTSYDDRNQIQTTTAGGLTLSYSYNYRGNRTAQTVNGTTTSYLWDEFSRFGDVVLERTNPTTISASYTLANGNLISQTRNGDTLYFLGDAQNSTIAMTNSSGAVTSAYAYDAFGKLDDSLSLLDLETSYLYTAQQYDPYTELYSLRARYYDPSQGRFLSRDTWAVDFQNPVELNRYGDARSWL